MQDIFCSPLQFLQRTDALASVLGCYLRDLPAKIGISERSMFGYRAGKYPVTAKALRKLEAAEQAAGISAAKPKFAVREANPKDLPTGNGEKFSADTTLFPDAAPEDLEAARREIAMISSRLAAIQARLDSSFAPVQKAIQDFPMDELKRHMAAAGAWPYSKEDGKLTPAQLWKKYASPTNQPAQDSIRAPGSRKRDLEEP